MRVYNIIIHVFGKVQGPTSTGNLHDAYFKVEPYPIPGSFLKLKYLKTELNVDNGTYAIV